MWPTSSMPSNVLNTMSSTTDIVSNDHHVQKSPTKRNHVHYRSLTLISLQLQQEQILQCHHFYHNLLTCQVSVGTLTTRMTQHRVDWTLIQATPQLKNRPRQLDGIWKSLRQSSFHTKFLCLLGPSFKPIPTQFHVELRSGCCQSFKHNQFAIPRLQYWSGDCLCRLRINPPAGYVTPPVFLITQLPLPWQATLHPTSPHTGCLPGGHCKGSVGVTAG